MIQSIQPSFECIGEIPTWIVGTQYYETPPPAVGARIFFERETDNPFDPHAVMAFDAGNCPLGHLPRYDARYLACVIDEGAIALSAVVSGNMEQTRIPIRLLIHATPKANALFATDDSDDWRAFVHNMLAEAWREKGRLSSATISLLREKVRPWVHGDELWPKTQLIYRLLKSEVLRRETVERTAILRLVESAVERMAFSQPRGWPQFLIFPIDIPSESAHTEAPASPEPAPDLPPVVDTLQSAWWPSLYNRLRYPPGARGYVLWARRKVWQVRWHAQPEAAEIMWYANLLTALKELLSYPELPSDQPSADRIRQELKDGLSRASIARSPSDAENRWTAEFHGTPLSGKAFFSGETLTCLELDIQQIIYSPKAPARILH